MEATVKDDELVDFVLGMGKGRCVPERDKIAGHAERRRDSTTEFIWDMLDAFSGKNAVERLKEENQ